MISVNDFLPKPKNGDKTADNEQKSNSDNEFQTHHLVKTNEQLTSFGSHAVHGSNSLIPLYSRENPEMSFIKPSKEQVEDTRKKTQLALERVLAQKASDGEETRDEPRYVKYTPSSVKETKSRTLKIVDVQHDVLDPLRHKFVRAPAPVTEEFAPVLKAPPQKLSAEERQKWSIPSSISGWKNSKGLAIPIEKRVAADGRSHEQSVGGPTDRMVQLSEALMNAETQARQEVKVRAAARIEEQSILAKEREARFRELAVKARRDANRNKDRSRSPDSRRTKLMKHEQERDISEQVALGTHQAGSSDAQFDTRLFAMGNRSTKEIYDNPLFASQQVLRDIYIPKRDESNESQHSKSLGPIEFEKDDASNN